MVALIKSGYFGNNKYVNLRNYLKTKFKPIKNANKNHFTKYNVIQTGEKEKDTVAVNNERMKEHMIVSMEKYADTPIFLWEFESINFFVSGNPLNKIKNNIMDLSKVDDNENALTCGIILSINKKKDKKKKQYCFANILTPHGNIEILVFSNTYEKYSNLIKKGGMVALQGKNNNGSLIVSKIKDMEEWLNINNLTL